MRHPNETFHAKAVLEAMLEERRRWITKLQTDKTRRGPQGADRLAIAGLKQECRALEFALDKF